MDVTVLRTTQDRFSRSLTRAGIRDTAGIGSVFWLGGLLFVVAALRLSAVRDGREALIGVAVASAFGCVFFGCLRLMTEDLQFRLAGPALAMGSTAGVVAVSVAVVAVGDVLPEVVVFYAEAPVLAFYYLRWQWASAITVLSVAAYGVVLAVTDASLPQARLLAVGLPVIAVGALMGPLAARAEALTAEAQQARADLAALNASLEEQVDQQVAELSRANEFRRFLAPEIAEAVMTADHLLAPHRREIAVFFSDLRGFTAFALTAEPEDVLQALNDYYACVGTVLRQHGATIGNYAGDGVMAFLGDPLPAPDLPRTCLRMASEARVALVSLSEVWQRRGHALGFGIGIALGHATLGVVGFEGRSEYSPIGSVVNLASRLCGAADNGMVLVDQRLAADSGLNAAASAHLELKGFGQVPVYTLP